MTLRLVRWIGTREVLRLYWGNDCPSILGSGLRGFHNAERLLRTLPDVPAWDPADRCFPTLLRTSVPSDLPTDAPWPTACDSCGRAAPPDAAKQLFREPLYDTPDGQLHQNDAYRYPPRPGHFCAWDDCDGDHLVVVLPVPGREEWDTSQRASNCARPDDRRHRCWVIQGEPPRCSSVESPRRCSAGKCSIKTPRFHKTLSNGEWA